MRHLWLRRQNAQNMREFNSGTLLRTLEGHTSGVWGSRNTGRAACYLGVMGQDAQSVGFE